VRRLFLESSNAPAPALSRSSWEWSAGTNADLSQYETTASEFMNSIGIQVPEVGATFNIEL
jgi:hypothetical protein